MSEIKLQATLKKIHIMSKNDLDSLDLQEHPNQIFATTDEISPNYATIEYVDSLIKTTLNTEV